MSGRNRYQLLLFILTIGLAFWLNSCANIVPPTGGIKDERPPVLVYSYPRNGETQFKGHQVVLEFDEDISLNNLNQELIISPNLNLKYKYEHYKKKLTLKFPKPLPADKTISLNFREGIKDFNEGNILKDLSLAFSTGADLDSINVTGEVLHAQTNLPAGDLLVGLFVPTDTFGLNKSKPDYFTKTNKEGKFRLQNLRADTFLLLAFNDANGNLTYDNKEERLAFMDGALHLTGDSSINLLLAPYDDQSPKVVTKKAKYQVAEIELDEGLDSFKISYPEMPIVEPKFRYITNESSIQVYRHTIKTDSIKAQLLAFDSTGNRLDTTFTIRFSNEIKDTLNDWDKTKLEVEPVRGIAFEPKTRIRFSASHPIAEVKQNKVWIMPDSTKKIFGKDLGIQYREGKAEFTNTDIKFDSLLYVVLDTQCIHLVTGKYSKPEKYAYEKVKPKTVNENASSISGTLPESWGTVVVELLNEGFNPVKTTKAKTSFKFTEVDPGKYKIRVVMDENGNGKWDKGNFNQKKQTETIRIWKEEILIKQGWDVEDIKF